MTASSLDHQDGPDRGGISEQHLGRRRFLTYLVAAPTLTVAARLGLDSAAPDVAHAAIPSPITVEELFDIADAVKLAATPTMGFVVLEVNDQGRVRLELPRVELGQGITTSVAMLVAEELDLPLDMVDVPLAPARPELVFNQLTAGSSTLRVLYDPVRILAATARARIVAAAAKRWDLSPSQLTTAGGVVTAPDGRTATYGDLSQAAASVSLTGVTAEPKPASRHQLIGKPTRRKDARAMVTGQMKYTTDVDVPGAMPTFVKRPPTIKGTVTAVNNAEAVERLPGVVGLAVIPTGVAVMAETFEQARVGVNTLDVTWGPGSMDNESSETIMQRLRAAAPPLTTPPLGALTISATYEWQAANHATLEPEGAVADVRADRAEIWSGFQMPIVAQQKIALALDLPQDVVTCHVVQAGGGFGRRCFWDAAMEAALVSKALGRPSRVMFHRTDDMRHARVRPPSVQKFRAAIVGQEVVTFDQRVANVYTDLRHGFGEILTATAAEIPDVGVKRAIGNDLLEEVVFSLMVSSPYNFGVYTKAMVPVSIDMNTSAYRSIPNQPARGSEEMFIDEIAARMRLDPVHFRRKFLKDERARAVLDAVVEAAEWGKKMPAGFAQGCGFHSEGRSLTACIVELDGRDPQNPRVTKAVIAVDVGQPINPMGIEAQMLGGLTEAISLTLRAGLHIKDGLPLEGSYSQYHFARQKDSPTDVRVIVMPASDGARMGGVGEIGMAAPTGAIGNAYARATGTRPRSFPIIHPIDFTPIPPTTLPAATFA